MAVRFPKFSTNTVTWGEFPATATTTPSISSHTDPVQPGDTATITVNDSSLVSGVEFGPVTGISFTVPTGTTIEYTVPDAFANGLAFQAQTVTVTDGTNTATISVTLDTPAAVDFEGTVSGFDSLDASAESVFENDPNITVVDGDFHVIEDPNNLIDTHRNSGANTYSATGDIFLRVLDVSDTTDSPQGTWTNERQVSVTENLTNVPVNLGITNLDTTSVRLTWDRG